MKTNKELSKIFNRWADILEFKGELVFKVAAYRRAAQILSGLTIDVASLAKEGKLVTIPGIGTGIAKKINAYLATGKIEEYEEAAKDIPLTLIDLLVIQGLGPKTLNLAYKELNIRNLLDLERAIDNGSLISLSGMGKKKIETIHRGIKIFQLSQQRLLLGVALPLVENIIDELKERASISQIYPAGSLRRMKETIGDIDILACGKNGEGIIKHFTNLSSVKEILSCGKTKGSVVTEDGVRIDLRVVEEDSFGAALAYFTGSKAHNIKLRELAKKKGLKINEYGIFRQEERIGGRKEEDIYRLLNLSFIPPEAREDSGEIELAASGEFPILVEKKDILCDTHIHSNWSDGSSSIYEIAVAAKELGYSYIVICDHSKSVKFAGGLSEDALLRKMEEVRRVDRQIGGIKVLCGAEADILSNGEPDYSDKILAQLDLCIGAIHIGFKDKVTERLCKAMENPYIDIIAHPTGRLISSREGYEMDLEKALEQAAKTETALEINAYYDRLDLQDLNCRRAKELGCKFCLGSDAHKLSSLKMMELGLGVARRAWLTRYDLINNRAFNKIRKSSIQGKN